MERKEVQRIFEAYFEKYKKTEGDRSSWSAVWLEATPAGALELNMTKCPKGTTFKIFVNKKRKHKYRVGTHTSQPSPIFQKIS